MSFGEQRIYASHHSIMFSRKVCYFFVRPKTKYLEVCMMLDRPLKALQIRNVMKGSKSKFANLIRITHRDEVEPPITDWLLEAYRLHDRLAPVEKARPGNMKKTATKRKRKSAATSTSRRR